MLKIQRHNLKDICTSLVLEFWVCGFFWVVWDVQKHEDKWKGSVFSIVFLQSLRERWERYSCSDGGFKGVKKPGVSCERSRRDGERKWKSSGGRDDDEFGASHSSHGYFFAL